MTYFKLFNSCRITKGAHNSMIYDLSRIDNSIIIPNSLYELLTEHEEKTVYDIKAFYNHEYDVEIDDYFEFLLENEYIFYCTKEELSLFPTLEFKYNTTNGITNSIIDFDSSIPINFYKNFIHQLSQQKCEAVEIRSYVSLTFKELNDFLRLFKETYINSIEIIVKYNPILLTDEILKLGELYPRLRKITFYNSPLNKNESFINFLTKGIDIGNDCGKIKKNTFQLM